MNPNSGERPCRDSAFHETTLIAVPLGPTGFSKVIFVDEDVLNLSVFLLCYVSFVIHFPITCFLKKNNINPAAATHFL